MIWQFLWGIWALEGYTDKSINSALQLQLLAVITFSFCPVRLQFSECDSSCISWALGFICLGHCWFKESKWGWSSFSQLWITAVTPQGAEITVLCANPICALPGGCHYCKMRYAWWLKSSEEAAVHGVGNEAKPCRDLNNELWSERKTSPAAQGLYQNHYRCYHK